MNERQRWRASPSLGTASGAHAGAAHGANVHWPTASRSL